MSTLVHKLEILMLFVLIYIDSVPAKEECNTVSVFSTIPNVEKLMKIVEPNSCKLLRNENQLKETIEQKVKDCLNQRFTQCYPNLSSIIDIDKINDLFTWLAKNPRLREGTGHIGCYNRAAYLAQTLANKGISVRKVFIGYSPTLIAFDLGKDNEVNGNFYDYNGNHVVIEVDVKEKSGEIIPYILDTQFMPYPVPRSEYFIRTMGQECIQSSKTLGDFLIPSLLNCYFEVGDQNHRHPPRFMNLDQMKTNLIDLPPLDSPLGFGLYCGWNYYVDENISVDTPENAQKIIRIMNQDKLPEGFEEQVYYYGIEAKLIIQAYEVQLRAKIAQKIEDLNRAFEEARNSLKNNLYLFEEDRLADVKTIENAPTLIESYQRQLSQIEEKTKEIRRNVRGIYPAQ